MAISATTAHVEGDKGPYPVGVCERQAGGIGLEVLIMMFWYGSHLAFWEVALMWVGMIAFWALIIWAVWVLITAVTRRSDRAERNDDARHILDQRLARGEIDADEYRRLRELLEDDQRSHVGR